jgi:hypothetical protein
MHHLASPRTLYSTSLFYNTSFGRFSLLLLPPHECSASGMSGCSSATGYTPYGSTSGEWQGARTQKICTAGQTLDTRQNRTDTHSVPRPLDESATRGPRRSAGELVRRAAQSSGARGRRRRRGRGGLRPRRPAAAAGLGALEEGRVAARARARADARAHAHLAALRRVELALAHLSVVAGTE